jgi:hypothetical protein
MIRPDGGSWSGSRDRFGERAAAVDADGRPLELLRLFASFTSAYPALADRLAQLDVDRPAVARTFGIERDHESACLILVSELVLIQVFNQNFNDRLAKMRYLSLPFQNVTC